MQLLNVRGLPNWLAIFISISWKLLEGEENINVVISRVLYIHNDTLASVVMPISIVTAVKQLDYLCLFMRIKEGTINEQNQNSVFFFLYLLLPD